MNEVDIKPSFPFSLKVFGNALVLKQQFINLKKLFFTSKQESVKNNQNTTNQMMIKNKDYQKKGDSNSHFLDNSNETDSLTIEEILDTLIETEKKEKDQRKEDF